MSGVVSAVDIQAPPSEVWRWMASEGSLRKWLSASLEIDLRVGGAYRLLGPDQETWISGASWSSTLDAYERGADRHRVLEQLAKLVG